MSILVRSYYSVSFMTLFSFGPLYIGLDGYSFNDAYRLSDALGIHLGQLKVELDWPPRRSHGSTQESHYIKDHS